MQGDGNVHPPLWFKEPLGDISYRVFVDGDDDVREAAACDGCMWPLVPAEGMGLRACIFDGSADTEPGSLIWRRPNITGEIDFYLSSKLLEKEWAEAGNVGRAHYAGGAQHAQVISWSQVIGCLLDGTRHTPQEIKQALRVQS